MDPRCILLRADCAGGAAPEREDGALMTVHQCCRCEKGWWDDETGEIVCCVGGCGRAFHAGCEDSLKGGVPDSDEGWTCGRCAGTDTAICVICDKEWWVVDKKSDYYTGDMVQCEGDCDHARVTGSVNNDA